MQQVNSDLAALQQQWNASPTNLQLGLNLAANLLRLRQTSAAIATLDRVLAATNADAAAVLACAQAFLQINNLPKLEATLQRLTVVTPDSPEAWYDLAAIKATLGKPDESIASLKRAIELSDTRLANSVAAKNLREEAAKDARFGLVRNRPEFQAIMGSN
jgi:tetratricopeptide (TPR) repeat protein